MYTWQVDGEFIEDVNVLTVVSYNIHYGRGLDGKINLDRTIETLLEAKADIISLQEVERYSVRTLFTDQVNQIAVALNMNILYYPSISYPGLYYGNVILSRFPIVDKEILAFSNNREDRSALVAKLKLSAEEELVIINTHLGLNKNERKNAIKVINKLIKGIETPVFLTGDLNSTPEMNEYEIWTDRLKKSNQGTPLQTFNKRNWQIDYIFHSHHFEVKDVYVMDSAASDHYPIVGLFQFKSKKH
ncbi:endonuclease/exonuclease/phosphatase family protein [Bacillaceae bacterium IKA-2]|nr:endonuclease/exonuclease/phosphatase family protein [Bacillaceae bacterium IKA-2]